MVVKGRGKEDLIFYNLSGTAGGGVCTAFDFDLRISFGFRPSDFGFPDHHSTGRLISTTCGLFGSGCPVGNVQITSIRSRSASVSEILRMSAPLSPNCFNSSIKVAS